MIKFRTYGNTPYRIALIHGGPGAAGEMKPVAEELSSVCGIIEPFQTKKTIDDQVEELKTILEKNTELPVILAGYSWGAWLCFIFAAKYPKLVKKLILVSSGPFEEKHAREIMKKRLSRMGENDKNKLEKIAEEINSSRNKDMLMAELGKIISRADAYCPLREYDDADCDYGIYESVWKEADELRRNGKLLSFSKKIKCPVVAIHGDYDSHPYNGVKIPLSKNLKEFKFVLLRKCGHTPWHEKYAKDEFYRIMKKYL